MTRLILHYAARSDVGLVREGNEDSGYAGAHMLVVADGMGGHAAGELASSTAIAAFAELDRQPPDGDVLPALADAVEHTQTHLAGVIAKMPGFIGMGTTVTALSWKGDRLALAHVGDSRAYLLRSDRLYQLTTDHTFVQTLVASGKLTKAQAAKHRKRNLLVKALDGVHPVEPDLSIREVQLGDRYLLCSDGLSNVIGDDELRRVLSSGDATGTVTALVDRALEGGAPDNVTCVVADVVADSTPAGQAEPDSMPVVVGAAAEWRNRDRLPDISFPIDALPDLSRLTPSNPTPAPRSDPASGTPIPKRKKSSRRTWLLLILAFLGATIAATAGVALWAHNQYYVGQANGYLAIYRGVPIGPGQNGWSSVAEQTTTIVASLPTYSQEQVQQTIPANGLEGARSVVYALQAQAAACQVPPIPAGCPLPPVNLAVPPTASGIAAKKPARGVTE